MRETAWQEIGDGVFRRRHPDDLDVNVGLVVGDGEVLLVDTLGTSRQGATLREHVRAVTSSPVRHVVNTHAHFDHCFGNAAFEDATLWGHEGCVRALREDGTRLRAEGVGLVDGPTADDLAATPIVAPGRVVGRGHDLVVGGRTVRLRHHGRGHTDHDLVVAVEGAGVLFAGDLVEEGGPPSFEDAWPLDWPATLREAVSQADGVVVPGHGEVVDAAFARRQADELAVVADLARRVRDGALDMAAAVAASPYPSQVTRLAVGRVCAA